LVAFAAFFHGFFRIAGAAMQPRNKELPRERLSVRDAFVQQDFVHLLLGLVPCAVALFIVNGLDSTHLSPFVLYDAKIALPYKPVSQPPSPLQLPPACQPVSPPTLGAFAAPQDSSIPYWVAVVVPLVSMLISVAVGEWAAQRYLGTSPTAALANLIHFTIDALFALVVTGLLTDVFKLIVGRYRPDWLMRCQPAVPSNVQIAYGQPASLNPACTNTALSPEKMRDGQHSFPSGHASTAFVLGVYVCVYCLWATVYRPAPSRPPLRSYSWKQRLVRDGAHTAVFYWILVQLSWAW